MKKNKEALTVQEPSKKRNIIMRNWPTIAAFLIPVLILFFIFIARDIYPFGENMYLRSDMYHQYANFLKEFQSILKNGDSLLYTWNIGLGTDFLGTYSYYLASPINWLVYFLPTDYIPEIMGSFIILKSGLMSATFAYYLKKHFGKNSFAITVFGVFYGMSSYMAAYSWNLMWLDCLVLLPLIVLGLEDLVKKGKVSLYAITLSICILSNYYISIMICMFLVLYFLYLIICERGEGKVGKAIWQFIVYSLLSGGIACVLLIPTIFSMMGSASNSFNFPTTLTWYFNFFEMVSHAAMNVEPTVLSGYIPNIYCTIGIFMLIPLFLICGKINLKEKIGKSILAAIFLVSFSCNVLSYIWHGFHYPNSLPSRESFIYIFLILMMAYEAFIHAKEYKYIQIAVCFGIGTAALIALQYAYGSSEDYPMSITLISILFLALYCAWLMLEKFGRIPYAVMSLLLVAIAVCEAAINTNATGYTTTSRTYYVSDNADIEYLLQKIDDDCFYRVEKVKRRTKNDGAWSNYMSASIFSSSARASISDLYEEWGMQSSMNSYSYYGHTPLTSAILGVKYELSSSTVSDSLMTEVDSSGDIILYENTYALSLGFAVDEALIETDSYISLNPFEAQNEFVNSACGAGDIFVISPKVTGSYISVVAMASGREYIYIEEEDLESITVTVMRGDLLVLEKEFNDLENPQIIEVCEVEEGDIISIESTDEDVTEFTLLNAIMDYDALEEAMELLSENQYEIDEFEDTYVSGTISVDEDCYMFTSIPCEYGWTVYVDGEKVETETYKDAFIAVKLSAGEHTVEFKYIPTGLYSGASVSGICLVIFILCMLRRRRVSKAKTAVQDQKE